jgi:phosphopantetheinyl transferase (holo-ACP synthase)
MMDSVQLWLATPDAAQHFDPAQLTDDERDRMARLRREARRQDFAVSRALRAHARRVTPSPVSESMSHSGGHAALALARVHPVLRLGVDLELHRARRRLEVASAVFTKSEMRALEAAPAPEREQLFYAIWTVKEALAKVLQLPLMEALRSCEVLVDGQQWQVRAPTTDVGGVVLYQPRAELTLAVAWIGAKLPIETWEWPPQRPASWPLIAAISL